MATTHNSSNLQPAFKRVAQQGRHDDTFAVIAMLTNKPMEAIFRQAEGLGLPKIGPFHAWIDGDMIAKLLAANERGTLAAGTRQTLNTQRPRVGAGQKSGAAQGMTARLAPLC